MCRQEKSKYPQTEKLNLDNLKNPNIEKQENQEQTQEIIEERWNRIKNLAWKTAKEF